MVIHGHRVKRMRRLARAARGAAHGKSDHAAIGVRPCNVSLAMRSRTTRQSPTTCSRLHSGKMPVEVEALVPVGVALAQVAQVAPVEVRDKVVLAVVAATQADKLSRAAAIVLPGQTTRRAVLSRTR